MTEERDKAIAHLNAIASRFAPKFECCAPVIDIQISDKPSAAAIAESLQRLRVKFRQATPDTLRAYSLEKLKDAGVTLPDKASFMQALEADIGALDEKGKKLVRSAAKAELDENPISGGWARAVQLHAFGMKGAGDDKELAKAFIKDCSGQCRPGFLFGKPIVSYDSLSFGRDEALQQALNSMGIRYHYTAASHTHITEPEKLHETGIALPAIESFQRQLPHTAESRAEAEAELSELFSKIPAIPATRQL